MPLFMYTFKLNVTLSTYTFNMIPVFVYFLHNKSSVFELDQESGSNCQVHWVKVIKTRKHWILQPMGFLEIHGTTIMPLPIEVNQYQFRDGYSFCGYTKFTEQTCPSTFNRTKHQQKWNQIWYQCQVYHSLLLRNQNSCYKCRCMVQDMSMTLCLVLCATVSKLLKTSFVLFTCSNS